MRSFKKTAGGVALAVLAALAGTASAQTAEAPPKAATCTACHGPNGNAPQGAFPVLAGQTSRYLYLQLRDYKEGRRTDPMMTPIAADLTKEEMRALSDYFSKQKQAQQTFKVDPEKARLGKAKSDETLCAMCHLGGLAGQNDIPRLAGQNYEYTVKQLTAFKTRTRTNDAGNMTSVASTLSEADIVNLSHYIAGL